MESPSDLLSRSRAGGQHPESEHQPREGGQAQEDPGPEEGSGPRCSFVFSSITARLRVNCCRLGFAVCTARLEKAPVSRV